MPPETERGRVPPTSLARQPRPPLPPRQSRHETPPNKKRLTQKVSFFVYKDSI